MQAKTFCCLHKKFFCLARFGRNGRLGTGFRRAVGGEGIRGARPTRLSAPPAVRRRPLLTLPFSLLRGKKSHGPRAYKQPPPFEKGTKVLGLPNEAGQNRRAGGAPTKPALNQPRRTVRAGET